MKEFVKSTIVGGLVFLLPLGLIAYVLGYAVEVVAEHVVQPTATVLQVGGWVATGILTLALVLTCFFAGVFARTHVARRAIGWIENSSLSKIPQYQQFKSVSKRLEQGDDLSQLRPMLAETDVGWQLCFLIEEMEGGFVAVYLPNVPEATTGRLAYVAAGRLRPLDLTAVQTLEIMWRYGIGSAKAIRAADLAPLKVE